MDNKSLAQRGTLRILALSSFKNIRMTMLAACVLINILGLAFPLLMLQLYDRILPSQSLHTLFLFLITVLIAILLEGVLIAARACLVSWLGAKFEHAAMMQIMSRFLNEPIQSFENKGTGEITDTLKSLSTLKSFYSGTAYQQMLDLPFSLFYLCIITLISPFIGIVLICSYVLFITLSWYLSRNILSQMTRKKSADLRRGNFINETLNNIHVLKSMTMELLMLRRYERLQHASSLCMRRLTFSSDFYAGLGAIFNPLMNIMILAFGASMVIRHEMSMGELAACIFLGMRALSPLSRMSGVFAKLRQDRLLSAEMDVLLASPGISMESLSPTHAVAEPEVPLVRHGADVKIKDLSYRFPRSSDPFNLINSLSLELAPGDFVTLEGPSGSGRTTLMQCLSDLLKPDSGTIELDGQSISQRKESGSNGKVIYLSMTARLFEGTLLENITTFDSSRVTQALHVADALGLTDFVSRLPRGWDTMVGHTASDTLPPGYRQRIAIVRGFASNPAFVLFDDANSHLDIEGDRLLLKFLASVKGQVTVLLVSQREQFKALANRRIVLEYGKAIEKAIDEERQIVEIQVDDQGLLSKTVQDYIAQFKNQQRLPDSGPEYWLEMSRAVEQQFKISNDYSRNLVLLMKLLNVQRSPREVSELLPYFDQELGLTAMLNTLAELGFKTKAVKCSLTSIPDHALPCLFVPATGPSLVVAGRVGTQVRVAQSLSAEPVLHAQDHRMGTAYVIVQEQAKPLSDQYSVRSLLRRFKPQFVQVGILEFCFGLLMVTSPLFLMSIYSTVIPAAATDSLLYLSIGAVLATCVSFFFMYHRVSILSYTIGRIDFIFGTMITGHLLRMPAGLTEGASVGSQTARIQSFDSIRDIFSGPMSATLFELPVSVVFLITLSLINPFALIAVVIAILAYWLVYLFFDPITARNVAAVGAASGERSAYFIESVSKMRLIKECNAEHIWLERFRKVSASASMASYIAEKASARVSALSHVLMMGSALLILLITVPAVMSQALGAGALVASTMLMWRILMPVQLFFSSLRRFENVRMASRQINSLMSIQGERFDEANAFTQTLAGKIEFSKVSFRYPQNAEMSLVGVDFLVEQGQCVAITGPDGSGKSTLFKLLLNLYQPQSGSILIDGIDIRQINPVDSRRMMGYLPDDQSHLFRATIAQNMRLVRPDADVKDILNAIDMAGGLEQVLRLPEQLEYRSGDNKQDLSVVTRRKLALARAYLTCAPILLLDASTSGFDPEADQKFSNFLLAAKGKITVLFVSHKPAHIRLADTLLVFDKGYLRANGRPEDLMRYRPNANEARQ